MKVFVDANIFMYAAGTLHPHKAPSLRLLERVADGEVESVSNTEALQEVLYRYWSIRYLDKGLVICDQIVRLSKILPVSLSEVLVARQLLTQHRGIEPRDAIHAAVMFNHGITRIYSYDRHFDAIAGLKRLTP